MNRQTGFFRKDCFAFAGPGKCVSCKIMACEKCAFYKPKEDVWNAVSMEVFFRKRQKARKRKSNHYAVPVVITFPDGHKKVFPSQLQAAAETGIPQDFISKICRGVIQNKTNYQITKLDA